MPRDQDGLWAGTGGEGAKFWMSVLTDIKIYLIRNTFRLASKKDWDALKRDRVAHLHSAEGAAPWDIAGGFAVAQAAGCTVVNLSPPARGYGMWGAHSFLITRDPRVAERATQQLRKVLERGVSPERFATSLRRWRAETPWAERKPAVRCFHRRTALNKGSLGSDEAVR